MSPSACKVPKAAVMASYDSVTFFNFVTRQTSNLGTLLKWRLTNHQSNSFLRNFLLLSSKYVSQCPKNITQFERDALEVSLWLEMNLH